MSFISTQCVGDILVISFPSATIVDSFTIQTVSDEMVQAVEDFDCYRLVLDFVDVDFVTSELLGRLLQFRQYCRVHGVSLKLANLSESFHQALKLTKLGVHFKVYPSLANATEMFEADDFVARHNFFSKYSSETEEPVVSSPTLIAPARLTFEQSRSAVGF